MKVVVLLGSPRKKDGYRVCQMIEEKMRQKGDTAFEYIHLSSLHIEECRGCSLCFSKGEAFCPLKDELMELRKKLREADGIIFSSPVYACHVTGSFKKVVDRLAFLFHRPELTGKPALILATTAGGGLKDTMKYLKLVAVGWGCQLVGSLAIISSLFFEQKKDILFFNPKYKVKMTDTLYRSAEKFYEAINSSEPIEPTFYDLFMFNGLRSKTYISEADYTYWKDKGWLNADYYYQVKIGIFKKLFGHLLNSMIKITLNKMGVETKKVS